MMRIGRTRALGLSFAAVAAIALTACDENGDFLLANQTGPAAPAPSGGRVVERDVEAPDVFSATEAGLWDGRPSLGGVWVAHPDVKDPERVIIRNLGNGKFVVGALFRREREIPGPRLQISSDAATALGILAGAPAELNVTALRREEVPEELPEPAAPAPALEDIPQVETVEAPAEIASAPLDPIAAASAALEAPAEPATPAEPAPEITAPAPEPAPAPPPTPVSSLSKPFLQVGIFSVQTNAQRTADRMQAAGMSAAIRRGETAGKPFWRVVVGPALTSGERRSLLGKIKAEGFTDAYAVSN